MDIKHIGSRIRFIASMRPATRLCSDNCKNSLFVGNERGGRTAAILSSITSTCRRHEIDPQRYITQLLVNLPTVPPSELDAWLPDRWKRTQVELPEIK